MKYPLAHGEEVIWRGEADIAKVKKIAEKNAVHLTRYAFCRSGGLFDQMPVRAGSDLVPLKKNLPTEKYGGYNKPTASFFVLAEFTHKKKRDVMLVPVELQDVERFRRDCAFACSYLEKQIAQIKGGKEVTDVRPLLNGRELRINTVFSFDGLKMALSGKSSGGRQVIMAPISPLILGPDIETYVKSLDSFVNKKATNAFIQLDTKYDEITTERNLALYDILMQKLQSAPFRMLPANPYSLLLNGRNKFCALSAEAQVTCLINLLVYFQRRGSNGTDLSAVGGSKQSGLKLLNSALSNWKKTYHDIRIIDSSPAGLSETRSDNLLDLL